MEEKLQELLQSEEFVKKLAACPNKNKVQELFASEDVELSMEEIDTLGNAIKQAIQKAKNGEVDGKLTEDDLEDVAGGVGLATVIISCIAAAGFTYGLLTLEDWAWWLD